jgi:Divergent InlB B-repeat domain
MLNRSHVVALVLIAGCSVSGVTFTPLGGFDAGGLDAGGLDAGELDTGGLDAGEPDAAGPDSGAPPAPGPTITVTKTGQGTVTSSPAGIDCGATCAQPFRDGTSVVLTAEPSAGFVFSGWSGACSGTACTIADTGSAGIAVSATFSPMVRLAVTLAGDATGTVTSAPAGISCGATCSAQFAPGASVILTATPTGTPSSFAGWSSPMCPGTGPCTQVLTADTTAITATFTKHGSATFTVAGNFTVPPGVSSVHVLAVGGGGGGANGHQGGGGSGLVATGNFPVSAGAVVAVTVGGPGAGAVACDNCNEIVGNTPGGTSSFGMLLSAAGGQTSTVINGPGSNGGSGGGGSCNAGSPGGAGASAGGNGGACTYLGGIGQGSFAAALASFSVHTLSAAPGGAGGVSSHSGGGGGGGVFLDGAGPSGGNGAAAFSGKGGSGFGGGGGAGGFDGGTSTVRMAGGVGARGVVYIEW